MRRLAALLLLALALPAGAQILQQPPPLPLAARFTTSVTTPLVVGGPTASNTLTLESTSGTGTTDAIIFKTGSQVEAARFTTAGLLTLAVALPATGGGTGLTSYTVGDLLYAPTPTTVGPLAAVATGSVLVSGGVGTAPAWSPTPTLGSGTQYNVGNGSQMCLDEEFPHTGTTTTTVGTYGWQLRAVVGGTATVAYQAVTYPHLGVVRLSSPAVILDGGSLGLDGNAAALGDLSTNTNWDSTFIFKLVQTTTTRFRMGLVIGTPATVPSDGLYLRYDTFAGIADTTWMFCKNVASGGEVCQNSGSAVDTNWHRLRIRSSVAGQVAFSLDGGAELCLTTAASGCSPAGNSLTLPTTSLTLETIMVSDLALTARAVDLDKIAFCAYGLSR